MSRRIISIADSDRLGREGQTQAMALLLSLNADLFEKCAIALRARAATGGGCVSYDYTQWADEAAYAMRDYYEANRPLRWWEKRNPPGSWGCIADNLMLGLLNIALVAERQRVAATGGEQS